MSFPVTAVNRQPRPRWLGRLTMALVMAGVGLTGTSCSSGSQDGGGSELSGGLCSPANGAPSVARQWNEAVLDAIRRAEPQPTVHARNLFHLTTAMWDSWAAFDPSVSGAIIDETRSLAPASDRFEAREDAMVAAAYTLASHRYSTAVGRKASQEEFDTLLVAQCGSEALSWVLTREDTTSPEGANPESAFAFGLSVGRQTIAATIDDGSLERNLYEDPTYVATNEPLSLNDPSPTIANLTKWQPLSLVESVTQNGLALPGGPQQYIGPQWGHVTAFALSPSESGLPLDPGVPPQPGTAEWDGGILTVIDASSQLAEGVSTIDLSPQVRGANHVGTDDGTGHEANPATGEPYPPNSVDTADFARAVAEFWADGPESETPPGHWNVLANEVADELGQFTELDEADRGAARLGYDIALYLPLNGALHDAAIAAWGAKRQYDYVRPVSIIRTQGAAGTLVLESGLVERVTVESSQPGERHELLADAVGEIAVYAWRGTPERPLVETSGVGWILASRWEPYQRPTFVTPSFPGYVSGHSAFSRAAAEVLSAYTGSEYFPGGIKTHLVDAGSFRHEAGPSSSFQLQWATYFDASDEAGRSRIWGGIHVPADDYKGRLMGQAAGRAAWSRAQELYGE